MLLNEKKEFVVLMVALFEEYDRTPKESVLNNWFSALKDVSLDDFGSAVVDYTRNEKFPPRLASVLEYLPNAVRISAEEAWAHFPKSEYDSAYVNQRMMIAWGVASALMPNEYVACKAFISSYNNQSDDGDWFWTQPEGLSWEMKESRKLEDYSKIQARKWYTNQNLDQLAIENGSKLMLNESNEKQVAELRLITKGMLNSNLENTGDE